MQAGIITVTNVIVRSLMSDPAFEPQPTVGLVRGAYTQYTQVHLRKLYHTEGNYITPLEWISAIQMGSDILHLL